MKAFAPISASLTALCALMGLVFCYELAWPLRVISVSTIASVSTPRPFVVPAVVLPPEAEISPLGQRPLFTPDRKPAPKPLASGPAGAVAPPPPQAWLVGVILARNERLALLRTSDGNLAQSYRVGEQIGSWLVQEIDNDHIVLTSGSFEHVMEINAGKRQPAATVVPAEAAP